MSRSESTDTSSGTRSRSSSADAEEGGELFDPVGAGPVAVRQVVVVGRAGAPDDLCWRHRQEAVGRLVPLRFGWISVVSPSDSSIPTGFPRPLADARESFTGVGVAEGCSTTDQQASTERPTTTAQTV